MKCNSKNLMDRCVFFVLNYSYFCRLNLFLGNHFYLRTFILTLFMKKIEAKRYFSKIAQILSLCVSSLGSRKGKIYLHSSTNNAQVRYFSELRQKK